MKWQNITQNFFIILTCKFGVSFHLISYQKELLGQVTHKKTSTISLKVLAIKIMVNNSEKMKLSGRFLNTENVEGDILWTSECET